MAGLDDGADQARDADAVGAHDHLLRLAVVVEKGRAERVDLECGICGEHGGDPRSIEFWHCNTCGCLTHYESTDKTGHYRIAVNARMMAPEDVAGIRLRTFDGAETWQYLD